MAFLSTNGITLCYQTDGDPAGVPLLLIMGLGMQMTAWPEPFVQGLVAQGFYVIRFDNRDCGLSSKLGHFGKPNLPLALVKTLLHWPLKSPYSLQDMAKDSLGVLDELGIGAAHVVGVSMGGMIAQILTAQYPQRVLSLTSIMSTSGRRGLPGPSRAARKAVLSRPKNPQDKEQVIKQFMYVLQTIGSPAYPTDEAHLRERIGISMARGFYPEGTSRQMLAIAASGSRAHLLRTIHTPSLIIHGDADPLVPLACGKDTAASIPGSHIHIFPGMGHDLPAPLLAPIVKLISTHCEKAGKAALAANLKIA